MNDKEWQAWLREQAATYEANVSDVTRRKIWEGIRHRLPQPSHTRSGHLWDWQQWLVAAGVAAFLAAGAAWMKRTAPVSQPVPVSTRDVQEERPRTLPSPSDSVPTLVSPASSSTVAPQAGKKTSKEQAPIRPLAPSTATLPVEENVPRPPTPSAVPYHRLEDRLIVCEGTMTLDVPAEIGQVLALSLDGAELPLPSGAQISLSLSPGLHRLHVSGAEGQWLATLDVRPRPSADFTVKIKDRHLAIETAAGPVREWWTWDDRDLSSRADLREVSRAPGVHTLRRIVENADGCRDTAIRVVHYAPEADIRIANVITPNGDGRNDVWHVMLSRPPAFFEARIHTPEGKTVFHTRTYPPAWTGRCGTRLCPPGTYFYSITTRPTDDDALRTYTGTVTIKY